LSLLCGPKWSTQARVTKVTKASEVSHRGKNDTMRN
jgi:hypothetical protein